MTGRYANKLESKNVVIVGGSSGLGYAVAEACLEYGSNVYIASSSPVRVSSAVQTLQTPLDSTSGQKVAGRTIDCLSDESCQEFFDWVDEQTGGKGFDHYVFTAGPRLAYGGNSNVKSFWETGNIDIAKGSTDLKIWGCLRTIQKAYPHMKDKGNAASITLTSGTNTYRPVKGRGQSSSVGGGILSMARGLAIDLAPVRVNVVTPAAVNTSLWNMTETAKQGFFAQIAKTNPTGHVAEAGEVAEAYLYCMRGTYTTGTELIVDGGRLLV